MVPLDIIGGSPPPNINESNSIINLDSKANVNKDERQEVMLKVDEWTS